METGLPLVSVGLPTYNRAASLERAIRSALGQTYRSLELVISDNASTDATEELCRRFAAEDPRIRYLRADSNAGAVANFNLVIGALRGDYAMVMGDDDWLDPDYIERCVAELERHPDHVLVGGLAHYVKDGATSHDGERIELLDAHPERRIARYVAAVRENGVFYGVARREALVRAMPLHDVLGADWLVVAALAFNGKVRTIEATRINRTLGSTSSSVRKVLRGVRPRPLQHRVPWLYTSAIAFADMAWRSPAYAPAGHVGRIGFALRNAPRFLRWKSTAWTVLAPPFIALRGRPRGRFLWNAFAWAVERVGGVPGWELDA